MKHTKQRKRNMNTIQIDLELHIMDNDTKIPDFHMSVDGKDYESH